MNRRVVYILSAIVIIFAGLASRRYRTHLPSFIGEDGGDVLWALMLFLAVSFVLVGRPHFQRCTISLVLACAVEVSQLYHAPWIDSIRNTTLGGLVLGFGFLWSDLVCYLFGIAAGVLADRFLWPTAERENTN